MLNIPGMRQLRTYNPVLAKHFDKLFTNMLTADEQEDFMYSIGGDMYVLQDQHEVDELMQCEFDHFDYHKDSGFWIGYIINNNSGGPTYLISDRFDVSKRIAPICPYDNFLAINA